MSIDLALLDRAEQQGDGWLRLYTWNPHCLSFGRHEPANTLYDAARIRSLGLDTVRRPTGGRAVWHARELTYAVAASWSYFGSLRRAYEEIQRLLSEVLRSLGVPASLAPRTGAAAVDAGACFERPAGGEVLVKGRKVVGSAQLRRGPALLQHGSILLQDEQAMIAALLRAPAADAASALTGRPGTGSLNGPQGEPLRSRAVAEAIAESALQHWEGTWEAVSDAGSILVAASNHYSHFRSPTWTWAR